MFDSDSDSEFDSDDDEELDEEDDEDAESQYELDVEEGFKLTPKKDKVNGDAIEEDDAEEDDDEGDEDEDDDFSDDEVEETSVLCSLTAGRVSHRHLLCQPCADYCCRRLSRPLLTSPLLKVTPSCSRSPARSRSFFLPQ